MASVSVLYIDDDVVAPHLELIRNVCEPNSKARPHVTVRFFERLPVPREHLNTPVGYIDLVEPGSFGLEPGDKGPNRTVYIRCESEELLPLEHKPHYPASEFHITLYDGRSVDFARNLLVAMKGVEWGFRVPLPPNTTLTELQIRSGKSKAKAAPASRVYSPRLKQIFFDATSEELNWKLLHELTDEQRLEYARRLATHLEAATSLYTRVVALTRKVPPLNLNPITIGSGADVHLTPPELAHDIAAYAVQFRRPNLPVHFGDPAVGTGAFYAALLQVLPSNQIASAIGIDVNEKQIAAANWRWAKRGMQVLHGDYLHMEKLPPRNLILANPPYLRHQGISAEYKFGLRSRASVVTGMEVSARSGLYVYFMLLSHAWMEQGAVAAWLIPSEFMQTDYGVALRHYLTHQVELLRVHRFGHDHPQFENAKVLPAVVVFRNVPPPRTADVILSSGGTLTDPAISERVCVEQLRREVRWFIPRQVDENEFSRIRIGDLFEIRRGIATGANDFFILPKEVAERMDIPGFALRPILPKARALPGDIIERDADGYPKVSPKLAVIDCHLSEDDLRTSYPRFAEYLDTARQSGVRERTLVKSRRPWYKQEFRKVPVFLCTYMGRGTAESPPIRFIWNKSDAIATNTYLLLYPRPKLASCLHDEGKTAELFSLLREVAKKTLSARSRTHADGLHKIEPGDLAEVRLAYAPKWIEEAAEHDLSLAVDANGS